MSNDRRWAELWREQAIAERRYKRLLYKKYEGTPVWAQQDTWPDERRCIFCRCFCETGGEQHHYPVPRRFGGEQTVLACRSCHDRADRMPLAHFDPQHFERLFKSLWDRAYPEERILIWKMATAFWDQQLRGAG